MQLTERQDILPPGYAQNEPWSGPEHRRRRRGERDEEHPGRRKHPVLLALLIIFALLLALAIGGVVWAEEQINPGGHHGPTWPSASRRAHRPPRSAPSWPGQA